MAPLPQQQKQDEQQPGSSLDRPLKDGERLLAPSRRPDGSLRKPVRIRAGYTPQDEVAIYQSKGALLRKGQPQVPPGYDSVEDAPQKPKTKSAKKNQKRKEKKHQADSASTNNCEEGAESVIDDKLESGLADDSRELADAITHQMNFLSVSSCSAERTEEEGNVEKGNLEKHIRALRKKIRAIESMKAGKGALNPEQAEKLSRLDILQKELGEVEAQKMALQ